jgi:transcriptional regulator with XRE-family HTH domain
MLRGNILHIGNNCEVNDMPKQEQWLADFGARLKKEREKQGLSQQALAVKALTRQDYIAQIERGVRNPALRTLMNLVAALDVSADHLIYGTVVDENSDDKEALVKEFYDFLMRRKAREVASYFEVVRFMTKFIEGDA